MSYFLLGEFAFVPLALAASVVEVMLVVYDAYDTGWTIASLETSLLEKGVAGSLFAAGAILPGGGIHRSMMRLNRWPRG